MKHSKRYRELVGNIEKKNYSLDEAVQMVKKLATAKFNESIDLSVKLNIDPQKTDQQVRGISNLPHGTGKQKKILVLTKGEKEGEAKKAGADYVGFDEYVEKIKKGWTDVDVIIATPDVMADVGKLGKILGPKGLMPSPKVGTVTFDIGKQVVALKKGKVEFKSDKTGCINIAVGRASFEPEKLRENILTFWVDLHNVKPQGVKGKYIKSISLSSTIGPAIMIDERNIAELQRKGGI
jgi:large subunit ribosomal protein L1